MTFDPTNYDHAAGPGKYEGNTFRRAAAYVHEITLNGFADEQVGTVQYGPGWYGLVYLDPVSQAHVIDLGWTPDADAAPESSPVVAIVHENDQGFVNVKFYDSEPAAEADWTHCEGAYALIDMLDEHEWEDDDGD